MHNQAHVLNCVSPATTFKSSKNAAKLEDGATFATIKYVHVNKIPIPLYIFCLEVAKSCF